MGVQLYIYIYIESFPGPPRACQGLPGKIEQNSTKLDKSTSWYTSQLIYTTVSDPGSLQNGVSRASQSFPELPRACQGLPGKIGQNWTKLDKIGQNWTKLDKISETSHFGRTNSYKFGQNWTKSQRLPFWTYKFVQILTKLDKIGQNCAKLFKFRHNCSNLGKIWAKLSKFEQNS